MGEERGRVSFLICLETADGGTAPPLRLRARLDRWHASRCLGGAWIVAANTTARIVYDSIAGGIGDGDRLIVCELDREALWYNLRGDAAEARRAQGVHSRRH